MCIISHKRKYAFVHIPRTAGGSLRVALHRANGIPPKGSRQHEPAFIVRDRLGEQHDDYFVFSFVRNPWDRLWSLYKFMIQRGKVKCSFDQFLLGKDIHHYYNEYHSLVLPTQRKPQMDWLVDDRGEIIVDFVGKYENLNSDLKTICKKIGIPNSHLQQTHTTAKRSYKKAYSDEGIEFVREHHIRDIEMFGYTF